MPKIAKIPPRGSRYDPFLSGGRLVGLSSEGTRDAFKTQFLPQWEDDENDVEAVLRKRFLMIDLGMAELAYAPADRRTRGSASSCRAENGRKTGKGRSRKAGLEFMRGRWKGRSRKAGLEFMRGRWRYSGLSHLSNLRD